MNIKHLQLAVFAVCSVVVTAKAHDVEQIFTSIYANNAWRSAETVSGPGSELRVTEKMRSELSTLIKDFNIKSIADAPCGDFNWMRFVDLGPCTYLGIDIVEDLIKRNINLYGSAIRKFKHMNLIDEVIDRADLIICRDMLAHLTYEQIFTVLRNFKQSGSKYLLATTIVTTTHNYDIPTGEWRLLNLNLPPFNFPTPLALIEEGIPFAAEQGKHLGLWLLEDITT